MTTQHQDLDQAIQAIYQARDFIQTRGPQLVTREELTRTLADLQAKLGAIQRPPIFGDGSNPAVRSGPYQGMTHFDLSILKAVREAAEFGRGRATFEMLPPPLSVSDGEGQGVRRGLSLRPARANVIPAWAPSSWEALKRAMDSTTASAGDEVVATGMRSEAWRDLHLNTVVSSFLPRIAMPTNPFDVPLELGDVTFYKAASENATVAETDLTTAKNTLTAGGVKAMTAWSYELDEDAIIAMLPQVRETFVRVTAETIDDLLLQADATVANSIVADGASQAATSRYLYGGGDGLIHLPIVDNTAQAVNHNAAISTAMFKNILAKMGKYALNPSGGNNATSADVVFISDLRTWLQGLALAEVLTVDKLGSAAVLRTGQLGAMFGVPWLVSGQMAVADTDGKVTSGGNGTDTGRVLAVNRRGWIHGFRREILIETERDIEKTQIKMVVSFRMAVLARGSRSSAAHTAIAYNITGV